MTNTVITARTAAATYDFSVNHGFPITISASALGAGETVVIKKYLAGTATAVGVSINSTSPAIEITGVGKYQIDKPVTAGSVGIFLDGGPSTIHDSRI